MTSEDRKLIERYLSGEGNSIDQMHNAERAREAVRRLLEDHDFYEPIAWSTARPIMHGYKK